VAIMSDKTFAARAPAGGASRLVMVAALLAFSLPLAAQQAQKAQPAPQPQPAVERTGKQVVDATCGTCHATGANGAPKIGDKQAWSKRAKQGLTSLTKEALAGIRKMPSHGGDATLTDL
jgi:cytochrome c5